MNRRHFLEAATVLGPMLSWAQSGRWKPDAVERMTSATGAKIAFSQAGFRPEAKKLVFVRAVDATSFEISGEGYRQLFPLVEGKSDLGPLRVGDFSQLTREGDYRLTVGSDSALLKIRENAWKSILPLMLKYHKAQRCGVEVKGFHAACHLDDAIRRDNGEHVDTSGGWHDAGDVRKWMDATMMNAFGMLAMARNLGSKWSKSEIGLGSLDEELRWGNRYFLKMQDRDGRVWADVAGGMNGDNSDNRWTDNVVGSGDDRFLNPAKGGSVQGMFSALQAIYADHFRGDVKYSAQCLDAAKKCWHANSHDGETEDIAWWTLAAVELYRTTGDDAYGKAGFDLASYLASSQQRGGSGLHGYWHMSKEWIEPFKLPVHGALPAFVLLEAARFVKGGGEWREAVRRHIEGYVEPLMARSSYGVMPFGVFKGSPTPEVYRKFDSEFTYRFFMPVRKQFWWLGLNGHLGSYALMLASAAREFGEKRYREMAYRQLEWTFGANPFAVSMASGVGQHVPKPFSPFVGVIPGGIMNGICGNEADEPVMDMRESPTWRTNEYWSPHVGYFEWAQSVLEAQAS